MKPKTKTPFRELTAAQKRVAIAKDVLKQISARRIKIKRGTFVQSRLDERGAANYNQASVRKLKSCTACAVGAAILCGIRLFNQISQPLIHSPSALKNWFSLDQVKAIEQAFECGTGYFSCCSIISNPATLFGKRYRNQTERAKAIFRNIIANKGRFVPLTIS